MHVKLALLADYANVTNDGKLNILGVFDRVFVAALPAVLPQMQLVLRFGAEYAERDRPQHVEITLDDPDGRRLIALAADVMVHGASPGQSMTSDQILTLGNLRLERPGGHTFNIFINNHLVHHLTMEVEILPTTEQPRLPGT
ncbi:hypothetical protein BH23GEM7_BH23GEM7_14210 [soil metagenome]|nr:hypothetical protein [Gemmatimonadota bacterium]